MGKEAGTARLEVNTDLHTGEAINEISETKMAQSIQHRTTNNITNTSPKNGGYN